MDGGRVDCKIAYWLCAGLGCGKRGGVTKASGPQGAARGSVGGVKSARYTNENTCSASWEALVLF
jgi:hypothetical protein